MPAATGTLENRIALNIVDAIKALNLTGTPGITGDIGANVFDHVIPEQMAPASQGFPCVIVEIARRPVNEGDGGTFEDRQISYLVRCWTLDQMRSNYQQVQQDYTNWNELIAEYFEGLVKYPILVDCIEVMTIVPGDQVVLEERAASAQAAKGYVDLQAVCYRKRKRNG